MRIDPVQVAANFNQAELASARRRPVLKISPEDSASAQYRPTSAPAPAPTQINVSIDGDRNVIYQFLDAHTGEVVQQVPPEQVLRVMRSIADMLRQSEQKFEISI